MSMSISLTFVSKNRLGQVTQSEINALLEVFAFLLPQEKRL